MSRASAEWNEKHKKQMAEATARYRQRHPDRIKAYRDRIRALNPPRIKMTPDERHEQQKVNGRKHRTRLRQEVLAAYGNKCVCCAEAEPKFLALDHVAGDGASYRNKNGP